MSEVRFGSPEDLSTEPFLTWWHIPVMVKVKRGWRGLKDNTVGFCMKLIMVLVVPLLAMPTGSMGWTATTDMLSAANFRGQYYFISNSPLTLWPTALLWTQTFTDKSFYFL